MSSCDFTLQTSGITVSEHCLYLDYDIEIICILFTMTCISFTILRGIENINYISEK